MKKIFAILTIAFMAPSFANDYYGVKLQFVNKKRNVESLERICIDGERSKSKVYNKQNVQAYYCDGGPDQMFYLYQNGRPVNIVSHGQLVDVSSLAGTNPSNPWYELRPVYFQSNEIDPKYCLDVAGYSGSSRDNVMYFECQGLSDQKWRFSSTGQIINKKNGLCLDISGYSGKSNTNMMLYHCDGYLDQEWYYSVIY